VAISFSVILLYTVASLISIAAQSFPVVTVNVITVIIMIIFVDKVNISLDASLAA
jgi:hypothetical protein